ncbi:hypothetical protein MKX01_026397 [Papaver californicum]|nr:hypothetical protein MKX01_026397 [Papaver californicum]
MDYYSINVGYLLFFRYDGNSLFRVTIFDMSATEIEYPIDELNHKRLCKKSSRDATEESDDSVEILDNTRLQSVNRQIIEVSTDTENERSDDEKTTHSHIRQNTFSEQSINQTKRRALEAAKAFKSKNPVCIVVMRPTHLYKGPVNVPARFARKYLIGKTQSVILSVKQRTWSVRHYSAVGNCYGMLTSGWTQFASDNHLKDGDVCVFELIDKKSFRMQVHVF